MADLTYTTRAGDTVEYVAWKHYGSTAKRVTEQVLEANMGLAAKGASLPAGVVIKLPPIEAPAEQRGIRLWT